MLLQKYDSTGSLIWEKLTLENTVFPVPNSLVIDNEDNIIIAGRYFKTSSSFNIEDSLVTGINGDAIQEFVIKFNADGNFKWFRTTNTSIEILSSYCQINGIDVDQTNNIFFIGKMYLVENDTPIPVTNRNGSNFFAGSMLLNTVTGLEQEYKTDEVTLYPNPNKGVVDIIVPQMAFETWSYKLYDLQGNIVKDKTIFFKDKITLDFSNLSTGIYTLVLIQDKKYFFKRIVIEH